jgi:hypothetical protein
MSGCWQALLLQPGLAALLSWRMTMNHWWQWWYDWRARACARPSVAWAYARKKRDNLTYPNLSSVIPPGTSRDNSG